MSLASALKGEYGLALGNIVGSNVFNSLAAVGFASAIQPAVLPASFLSLHVMAMAAFTLVLFVSTCRVDGEQQITRIAGFSLLVAFIAYAVYTIVPDLVD